MSISSHRLRKLVFLIITFPCVSGAMLYTLFSIRRTNSYVRNLEQAPTLEASYAAATAVSPSSKPSAPSQEDVLEALVQPAGKPSTPSHNELHGQVHLISLNLQPTADVGKVQMSGVDAVDEQRTTTDLRCERIYFAANKGICLTREIDLISAQTVATLVDANFRPLYSVRTDGIPTRARVSPDGRYAAFTVFVTGHSYADTQLSTATLLLDTTSGAAVANLEEFKVFQDGKMIESVDFNYWGVTFQQNSNLFYATLRTGGVNYLVHGDTKERTVTVMYKNVECPSLSPDETRIAFKRMISRGNWRLTVLNLSTFEETPLAETKSVDDQAEWLDNDHLLYAMPAPPWMNVMVVPADGSGLPKVFLKGASSPAVTR